MAQKPIKKQESKQWNKAKWIGFVNLKLSQQEKEAIKSNLLSAEDGIDFLMNVATAGYKFSTSYSIPEDVYTLSLTGQYQEKPNAGITMSMRHRDFVTALTALNFCAQEDGLLVEWSDRYTIVGDDDW